MKKEKRIAYGVAYGIAIGTTIGILTGDLGFLRMYLIWKINKSCNKLNYLKSVTHFFGYFFLNFSQDKKVIQY